MESQERLSVRSVPEDTMEERGGSGFFPDAVERMLWNVVVFEDNVDSVGVLLEVGLF